MGEHHTKPGRLTNPNQHSAGGYEGQLSEIVPADGLPTSADPHPPEEENPYQAKRPGGAGSRHDINRVNDYVTDGKPRRRPDNVESGKPVAPGS